MSEENDTQVSEETPLNDTVKKGAHGRVGHFVRITAGELEGRIAAFEKVDTVRPDGNPKTILVRTRDADNIYAAVPFKDVEHAGDYHGGR